MLKNIMEILVSEKLEECWLQFNTCKCDKCKMDVLAYTLNQLPAKYVVTNTGELYAKVMLLSKELEFQITIAIAKSIKVVSDNPKHESIVIHYN